MRIARNLGCWWLTDGDRNIKLLTTKIVGGRGKTLSDIYRNLQGKELGTYEQIIDKSFELKNNGQRAILTNSFILFVEAAEIAEEEKLKKAEEVAAAAERARTRAFEWDYFDDWGYEDYNYRRG